MAFETLSFNVAGVTMDNRQEVIADMMKKKCVYPATLKKEPDNQYDPNAVEIYVDGKKLGYVPAELSEDVNGLFESIVKASTELLYSEDYHVYYVVCSLKLSIKGD